MMGPYAFSQAFLSGSFAFAALSSLVMWWNARRDRQLLILTLVCCIGSVQSFAALYIASATTIEAGQLGIQLRTLSGALNIVALTWLFAGIAGIRARAYVWFVTAVLLSVCLAIVLRVSVLGGVVISLDHATLPWGETFTVLQRTPPRFLTRLVYLVIATTLVFQLICAWRFRKQDRTGGTLLMFAAVGSLAPLLSGILTDMARVPLPFFGSVGIVATALVVVMQLVDTRRREAQLTAAEHRFRAIFDQIVQLTGLVRPDGTLLEMNRSALTFAGVQHDDVVGRPLWETPWWNHSPELQSRLREAVSAAAKGDVARFEARHRAASGELRHMDFSLKPVRDANGEVALLIPESRDIHERVVAEEAKLALEHQLAQAHKMEALGQLAGGVAHDFNNLLTVIVGHTDIALADADNEELRSDLRQIRLAADQAASMTAQLLTFTRQSVVEPSIVNANAVVADAEVMLRRTIGEQVQLLVRLEDQLSNVRVDPRQLSRVLINLAINARDAMPNGGTLTIETRNVLEFPIARADALTPGPHIVISMSDTGVGMPSDVLSRLFEPFFTTKEAGQGTGLGLAVVQGVVRQSGGQIVVESELGKGSTFRVYLPAVDQPRVEPGGRDGSVQAPVGSETVLLVEDETAVREITKASLQRQGYQVIAATGGAEALRELDAHLDGIDLLITDVVMPSMSGPQLVEQLRRRWPLLPVLFISGYASEATKVRVEGDRTAYLPKPFTPAALASKVRTLLDR
jgi:two-component system cell cycle sensor histidine kinase/response regulator CckA